MKFISIPRYGNSTNYFFSSYRKKQTCKVGLGTMFLNDLEKWGLCLMKDSKTSPSRSNWVCFTCNLYPFSASQMLQKWVELPWGIWNGSVILTLTWVLRLNNNLLSWKFNVCRSFFGFFCYLTLSSLYWHTTVGVDFYFYLFIFLSFFLSFSLFCPHRNLMAQELTNKKLFYNKVDCNQQWPGVTQWTKIQDQLRK